MSSICQFVTFAISESSSKAIKRGCPGSNSRTAPFRCLEPRKTAPRAVPARIRLETFLAARSPLWRQVGRVCFHLAENKKDPEFPFVLFSPFINPGLLWLGLSRGRAYVRNGSGSCHLEIDAGTDQGEGRGSRKRLAVSSRDFAVVLGEALRSTRRHDR